MLLNITLKLNAKIYFKYKLTTTSGTSKNSLFWSLEFQENQSLQNLQRKRNFAASIKKGR